MDIYVFFLRISGSWSQSLVWPGFLSVNFTPEVVPGANEFPPGGNLSMKHEMKDRLLQGVLLVPGACVALLAGPGGQHSRYGTGAAGLQVSLHLSGADLKCERVSKTQWERCCQYSFKLWRSLVALSPGLLCFCSQLSWGTAVSGVCSQSLPACWLWRAPQRQHTSPLVLLSDCRWALLSPRVWFCNWIDLK